MSFQFRSTRGGLDLASLALKTEPMVRSRAYRQWAKRAFDLVFVAMISLPVALTVLLLATMVGVIVLAKRQRMKVARPAETAAAAVELQEPAETGVGR